MKKQIQIHEKTEFNLISLLLRILTPVTPWKRRPAYFFFQNEC